MNFLSPGFLTGLLTLAAALANAFHYPALATFFSDPATATNATNVIVGVGALIAGVLQGVNKPAA